MVVASKPRLDLFPAEIRAFTPPVQLTVSEWAGKYRFLDERYSSSPGPIVIEATPYVREILDAFSDPEVEWLTLILSRQMAKSTTIENMIGYAIHQAPGPAQLVLPREQDASEVMQRVRAMIEASPAIRAELREDRPKANFIQTGRMHVSLGYATSVDSLKGRSNRYLFLDEAEAYRMTSEGHPIDIAEPSTDTFYNRKIVEVTTPKLTDGRVWRNYLGSDQRRWQMPCPHCGEYQEFVFDTTRRNLRWPKDVRDAGQVKSEQLATYHCIHCDGEWKQSEKNAIVARGLWVPRGCWVEDGELCGVVPKTTHRGYQGCCLLAPWTTFSDLAASWLKLHQYQRQEFWNLKMGLPYDEVERQVTVEKLSELEGEYSIGEIPDGVQLLIAGVDAQREGVDHCYYSVDGYGQGGDCWHIEHGVIAEGPEGSDLERVRDYFRERTYQKSTGERLSVYLVGIDSGDGARTDEVYDIANRNPGLIVAVQGFKSISSGQLVRASRTKKANQLYIAVNTDLIKRRLTGLIANPPKNVGRWWIPRDTSAEYRESMVSEHLVTERSKSGESRRNWRKREDAGPNHYWDCRVYSQALAEHVGVEQLPSHEEVSQASHQSSRSDRRARRRRSRSWVGA